MARSDGTGRPAPAEPNGRFRVGVQVLREWRPTLGWIRSLLRSAATSFVVLALALWLMPGITSGGLLAMLWLVVLVAAVGALLRPLFVAFAIILGGLGGLAVGICVRAVVLYTALRLDPSAHVASFGAAFLAAWIAATLAAIVNWLADAGTDDLFVGEIRRRMIRFRRLNPRDGRPPGLLVVQIDGVAAPLLQWAIRAGNLPNIGRLLRVGSHRMTRWHTGLPATTPAAQAGILHGRSAEVPAFRWYEKETGRLIVTNRPRDAAEIEGRLSDGRGLLAGGGASISNVFSGDAEASLLTISRANLAGRTTRGYAAYVTSPYGLARAVILGVGELLKELHQARLQRRRDVQPRIRRLGAYLALRPITNVLLRDLTVSLVAEQMARGAPVIFCDFVDYDEVAHHAGPARPEALTSLEGLDRVIGILHRLTRDAGRDYQVVVLSDHGQSQGATFQQRYGETLEQVVRRLVSGEAVGATGTVEDWGRINMLLTEASRRRGPTGAATRALRRHTNDDGEITLGPADDEARAAADTGANVVVAASGNLAMVYLCHSGGKLSREQIGAIHPDLIAGLAAHPGVGLVVIGTDTDGPLAVGGHGWHRLADGAVGGTDPLLPYGPHARADLLRHQAGPHVGDLVLISVVDPSTDEVAAFEELVGCHGGLGGWQTEAILLHPAAWAVDTTPLIGPDAVHRQLVRWADHLGLRTEVPAPPAPPAPPAAPTQPAGVPAAESPVHQGR
jgi:hypothetical protein